MSGSRMALARKLRGLTQTELAKKVGISPRAISKYEKDGAGLSAAKISEIAQVLLFDPSFFTGQDIEAPQEAAVSFRARSKMSAKKRNQALAVSAFGLMLSDWMDDNFILPSLSIPDFSGFEPEIAALALRMEWGLSDRPVADMIAVLESHGVRVFSMSEASQEIDAYSFWDESRNRPFVFLTTSKSGERRRMDAAHELGHLVLHRKVELDGKDMREVEREANEFGSTFLMPDSGFRYSINRVISLREVMRVKKIWKVSAFAVAVRAHALGLISNWQYHELCVNMSKMGMRTNELDGITPERSQVADKMLSLVRKDYGSVTELAGEVGIPQSLILGLTFGPSVELIQGGFPKTKREPAVSNTVCDDLSNFRLV